MRRSPTVPLPPGARARRVLSAPALAALVAALVAVIAGAACGGSSNRAPHTLFFTSSNALYSVAEDGSGLKSLAAVSEATPQPAAFSSDGTHLAHPCRPDGATDQSQTALCVSRIDGTDAHTITEQQLDPPGALTVAEYGGGDIAWSPDGRNVAFLVLRVAAAGVVSSGDVYVCDLASGSVRRVDQGAFAELRESMRWSPDNRHIAVPTLQRLGASGVIRIIDIGKIGTTPSTHDIGPGQSLADYEWSPDGSLLAFAGGTAVGTYNVYVVPVGGGTPVLVMQQGFATKVAWSPDSRSLAVTAGTSSGQSQVFVVAATGGSPVALTPDLYASDTPAWSPDSQAIALFAAAAAAPPNRFPDRALYTVSAAGGTPRKLTGDQQMLLFPLITWAPDGKRVLYTAEGGPCFEGCPPGPLFAVPRDTSAAPQRITTADVKVDELLGWR